MPIVFRVDRTDVNATYPITTHKVFNENEKSVNLVKRREHPTIETKNDAILIRSNWIAQDHALFKTRDEAENFWKSEVLKHIRILQDEVQRSYDVLDELSKISKEMNLYN